MYTAALQNVSVESFIESARGQGESEISDRVPRCLVWSVSQMFHMFACPSDGGVFCTLYLVHYPCVFISVHTHTHISEHSPWYQQAKQGNVLAMTHMGMREDTNPGV